MTKSTSAAASELLKRKLAALPVASGCYLFKNGRGHIVYVGKAKNLRSRVRSYFTASSGDGRYFMPTLRQVVVDVETLVTAGEKEAAVLENELIKQHRPRFNVKLRDDKDFLCLRLDARAAWPRLETVRRPKADGARYFGPYHSATSARRTLHLVNKHFQLRTCSDAELRSRARPCLQYQIKRCPAPCVLPVDADRYAAQVRAVGLFLNARHDELTGELRQRMQQASAAMEYELAVRYRDQLCAIESILERQRVVSVRRIDQDVVGWCRRGELGELVLMLVRRGHVTDSRSFSLGPSALPDEELVAGFLGQYYASDAHPGPWPDEIVLPVRPDAVQGLAAWLSERRGSKVRAVVPRQGARRRLLDLACDNAAHAFTEKQRAAGEVTAALTKIQQRLRLPTLPRAIECCDISHLGGGDAVGAVVCFRDGQPDKRRYRSFSVHTTERGDDYAAMHEVLARRFRRGRDAGAASQTAAAAAGGEAVGQDWELPDLFVVDGGPGQLKVALAAAHDLGLHELCIVGLAKERVRAGGDKVVDRVYLPGQKNPVGLRPPGTALALLARARDEAHRFANAGRKRTGRKARLHSELDAIRGIGPVARRALLGTLGSMEAVRLATDEQILAVDGVSRRHLTALRKVIPPPG